MLFGVFTAGEDHNGATLGFQHRMFQQLPQQEGDSVAASAEASGFPPPRHRPWPVPMRIINLGSLRGGRADRDYEPLAPVAGLSPVERAVPIPKDERQLSNGAATSILSMMFNCLHCLGDAW